MKLRKTINGVEFIGLMGEDKTKAINGIIDMLNELSNNNKLSIEYGARTHQEIFTDRENLISLTLNMNNTTIIRIILDDYINNRIFDFAVRIGENNSDALLTCIKQCKNRINLNKFKDTINDVLESNK